MSKRIANIDWVIFVHLTTVAQVEVALAELDGDGPDMNNSFAKTALFAQSANLAIFVDIFDSGFCQLHLALNLVNHSIFSHISLNISIPT